MKITGRFFRNLIAIGFILAATLAAAAPVNLAPRARISADSEYNTQYLARFVADGVAQAPGAHNDVGHAWCVVGKTHKAGATLRLEWKEPVTLRELVLYGRTAWYADEFWRDCEIFIDNAATPALKTKLQNRPGPQRLTLPAPIQTRALTIRFSHPFGGLNPGLAELLVYETPVPDADLAKAVKIAAAPAQRPNLDLASDAKRNQQIEARPASSQLREALLSGALGFRSLVVVQRRPLTPSHVYTYHQEGFGAGGGLFLFTPSPTGGALKQLVATPQGQILDYDLSCDGREILFSWRQNEAATYQLFTIHADGSGLRQLTRDAGHNFNASWLPDGGIVFLSTRRPAFAYCWTSPVGILHRMDRDGKSVVRISANYLNDFTPTVAGDGRILYGRWEYVDRPAIPIQSLWTINPDGTGLSHFFGNRVLSPATFIEARTIPGSGRALCTMTAHNGPCRGAIGIIDRALGDNAQAAIHNLTPDIAIGTVGEGSGNNIKGPYENPYPLDGRAYLVSRDGTIQLRDYDNARLVTVLAPRGGLGFYSPQPLRARPQPPVVISPLTQRMDLAREANLATTATARPNATVVLQDVYQGLEPWVRRGEVKQIAVVQEIEKSRLADVKYRCFGFQFPVVSCGATYAPKKVWGYAPVAPDGSACFSVPAGVPIYFMVLDAQGRAVQRMRSFTHLMPGERQGCVGCHEPRRMTPRAERRAAGALQPVPLQTPEWGLTGFSYNAIVQPVLDAHCVRCHNAERAPQGLDLSGDLTDFFNVSYENLARAGTIAMDADVGGGTWKQFGGNPYTKWIPTYNGMEESIPKITPKIWGSPVSRLAEVVLSGHPGQDGKPRFTLSDAERRRILAWIDLNVPYYGTSSSHYLENKGCRQQYPPQLDRVLEDVAARRCAACHTTDGEVKLPRAFWVRLTHPEKNTFLSSPLARAAGGSGRCGKAVFTSTTDPDYQALLKTFEPVTAALQKTPREDMVQDNKKAENTLPHSINNRTLSQVLEP